MSFGGLPRSCSPLCTTLAATVATYPSLSLRSRRCSLLHHLLPPLILAPKCLVAIRLKLTF